MSTMEVPSFEHELNRKAVNALSLLLNQRSAGIQTDEALHLGVLAIYNCVSGLVPRETIQLVEQAEIELRGSIEQQRRVG